MKKVLLQLQDINGNVEKENEISLGEDDLLIMQFPRTMSIQEAHEYFKLLQNSIETGGVCGLSSELTFKVIKKDLH